jgi:hypothetical protein
LEKHSCKINTIPPIWTLSISIDKCAICIILEVQFSRWNLGMCCNSNIANLQKVRRTNWGLLTLGLFETFHILCFTPIWNQPKWKRSQYFKIYESGRFHMYDTSRFGICNGVKYMTPGFVHQPQNCNTGHDHVHIYHM